MPCQPSRVGRFGFASRRSGLAAGTLSHSELGNSKGRFSSSGADRGFPAIPPCRVLCRPLVAQLNLACVPAGQGEGGHEQCHSAYRMDVLVGRSVSSAPFRHVRFISDLPFSLITSTFILE